MRQNHHSKRNLRKLAASIEQMEARVLLCVGDPYVIYPQLQLVASTPETSLNAPVTVDAFVGNASEAQSHSSRATRSLPLFP